MIFYHNKEFQDGIICIFGERKLLIKKMVRGQTYVIHLDWVRFLRFLSILWMISLSFSRESTRDS